MGFCKDRKDPARNNALAYHPPIWVQGGRHHDVVARLARISLHNGSSHWRREFGVAPRAEPDWCMIRDEAI